MEYFKVNQVVYSRSFGEGIVTKDTDGDTYPIKVSFKAGNIGSYTIDGRYFAADSIDLYQSPPQFKDNVPLEQLFEEGELVWVREHSAHVWEVRYYKNKTESGHECYTQQRKEGRTSQWYQCRKFNDNPLT